MVGWNWLYYDVWLFVLDLVCLVMWNCGKYLVDGVGYCGVCYMLCNVFGVEKGGFVYLLGGEVEGWVVLLFVVLLVVLVLWIEGVLFDYLCIGFLV